MFRLVSLIVIGSLAACGSSGSGVDTSKKLTALSADERQQLCEYMVEVEGGVHSKTCGDGITLTVRNATECATGFASFSASCTATVENAEACAEAAGDDLCNLLTSPACSFLFQCAGGG